ncbi:MAG: potassium transporter, partial [Halobacteria archaeon]|nr:potassium transporter [Halobacteria archaeon]
MHWLAIQRLLGVLLMLFSVTLLPPMVVSLLYKDAQQFVFLEDMVLLLIVGCLLWIPVRNKREELRVRDGFLFVTLFWLVLG